MTNPRAAKAIVAQTGKATVHVLHVPQARSRLHHTVETARAASRPVWVTVVAETLAVLALLGLAGLWAYQLTASIDTTTPPPYQALALFPLIGGVARLARFSHVGRALHRWHGHLLRRIDQCFAHDLEPDDETGAQP